MTRNTQILKSILEQFFELSSINQIEVISVLKNKSLLIQSIEYWKRQLIVPSNFLLEPMLINVFKSLQSLDDFQEIISCLYVRVNYAEFYAQHFDNDVILHPNGTDKCFSQAQFQYRFHQNIINTMKKFFNLYAECKHQNYSETYTTLFRNKCKLWAELYITKEYEHFDSISMTLLQVTEFLFDSRLITYQYLYEIWNASDSHRHKMRIADYLYYSQQRRTIFFSDQQNCHDMLMQISPELHQLYVDICTWFQEQLNLINQNNAFHNNTIQNNRWTGAHSIHILDQYRGKYLIWLDKNVAELSLEQMDDVEKFIKSLYSSEPLTQEDKIIDAVVGHIYSIASKFKVETSNISLSMKEIFHRVCWYIMNLKSNEATERLKQELKDMLGTCTSGHINRLFNALDGFIDLTNNHDQLQLVISMMQTNIKNHERSADIIEAMGSNENEISQVVVDCIKTICLNILQIINEKQDENQVQNNKNIVYKALIHNFGISIQDVFTVDMMQ